MDLHCTRPGCPRPRNGFADLDDPATLKTVPQKFCTRCGMPLILLGRYLPSKLLGQGGFGAAFLARDRYTPGMRQCVVKQFQPSGNLNPSQLATAQTLFEREAEVLEDLGNAHPQIPDLFAFFELTVPGLQPGKQDKFFYLVQEFIDGQTMEEELGQKGSLSSDEVQKMLEEILSVLQFVHDHGSIHRDIKPSNIMRHRNGRFYLLDFGAVRQATKGTATKSTGIYSLGFAPPEQMSGGEVYPSSDLYALAVTAVMLLTGKEPNELFDSYSNAWNWRSHAPKTDPILAAVLDRLLLPTPSDRFASATETLTALHSARPAPGLTSSPTSSQTPIQTPPIPPITSSAPPPPTSTPTAPTTLSRRGTIAPFSTLELLANSAFTGFEAALLAIGLFSLPISSLASAGLWLLLSVGCVLAQSQRLIERVDLVILAAVTLGGLVMFPGLRSVVAGLFGGNALLTIGILAGLGALAAIAITALFRLIYTLLSKIL